MLSNDQAMITRRPFRMPHHTISDAGLIGGGRQPRPGEISLAHNGVLFLDELPEFRKNALEALRQPLEDSQVTIARAATTLTYPCSVMLVAAMNPCPCGFSSDSRHGCRCSQYQLQRYHERLSGPLLDRIDIQVEVPAVPHGELTGHQRGEPSHKIRARVFAARQIQSRRFENAKPFCNAKMDSSHVNAHCQIDDPTARLLQDAVDKLALSARAYHRVLKVARTIADLAAAPNIAALHVAEAIQYQALGRN